MVVLTVCYKSGVSFNEEYYLKHHVPLVQRILTPLGLRKTDVRRPGRSPDGSPAPYQLIGCFYFDSLEAYQAASKHTANTEARDDMKNYYDGAPDVRIDEVVLVG